MTSLGCSTTPTTVYKTLPYPSIPDSLKTPQCAPQAVTGDTLGDLVVSWVDNTACANLLHKQIEHIVDWGERIKK